MLSSPQFLTLLWVENRLCEGPVGVNGPAQPGLGCLRIPAWWQGGCGSWVAAWGCPMWTCWDFVLTRELLSGGASCRGYECGSQCLCGARGLGWQGRGQAASQPRVPPSLSLLRTLEAMTCLPGLSPPYTDTLAFRRVGLVGRACPVG